MLLKIFVALFVLGAVYAFIEWAVEERAPERRVLIRFLMVVITVGLPFVAGIPGLLAIPIDVLILLIRGHRCGNRKKLLRYLELNCMELGYVPDGKWASILPEYAKLNYDNASFSEIVSRFSRNSQRQFIENADPVWLDPLIERIHREGSADISELVRIGSPVLRHTHGTPDTELIYEALEKYRITHAGDNEATIDELPIPTKHYKVANHLHFWDRVPNYVLHRYKVTYHNNEPCK